MYVTPKNKLHRSENLRLCNDAHFFHLTSLVSFTFSYSEGGFLSLREEITGSYTQGGAFSPALGSRVFSYADDDTTVERNIYDLPDYSEPTSSPAPQVCMLAKNKER